MLRRIWTRSRKAKPMATARPLTWQISKLYHQKYSTRLQGVLHTTRGRQELSQNMDLLRNVYQTASITQYGVSFSVLPVLCHMNSFLLGLLGLPTVECPGLYMQKEGGGGVQIACKIAYISSFWGPQYLGPN